MHPASTGVNKALAKVPGVTTAEVNLAAETATVGYDPAHVTVDALVDAVATAGYPATPAVPDDRPRHERPAVEDDPDARREAELARAGVGMDGPATIAESAVEPGHTVVHVAVDSIQAAVIVIADTVRAGFRVTSRGSRWRPTARRRGRSG